MKAVFVNVKGQFWIQKPQISGKWKGCKMSRGRGEVLGKEEKKCQVNK